MCEREISIKYEASKFHRITLHGEGEEWNQFVGDFGAEIFKRKRNKCAMKFHHWCTI